jgi:hypothetical protein
VPVPEITNLEIEEARRRSPDEARRLEQSRAEMRLAQQSYMTAFGPLKAALAAAGFEVDSVGGLREQYESSTKPYRAAIPVLVEWLDRVEYPPLRHDIVRTLSVPWAKPEATQPLIDLFRAGPEDLRWDVANAIEQIADPAKVEEVTALVRDRTYGDAREPLVRALGKIKAQEPSRA